MKDINVLTESNDYLEIEIGDFIISMTPSEVIIINVTNDDVKAVKKTFKEERKEDENE